MVSKCNVPTSNQAKTAPPQPPNQNPLVKSAQPALVNKSFGGLLTVASGGWTLGALPGALYRTKSAVKIWTAPIVARSPAVRANSEFLYGPVIVKGPYRRYPKAAPVSKPLKLGEIPSL